MPVKKKTSAKKPAKKTIRHTNNHARGGTYFTPKGNVSIAVPPFWFFRQTNDDLELDSPSTATSIVISAFHRTGRVEALDSREYMKRFLQTAPAVGRKTVTLSTKQRTAAKFKDSEGANWQCEFLTDGNTLLLATLNSTEKPRSPEAHTAGAVLDSIKIVKR
ncbi:hypothetical protein Acid345_2385 [Candidatus Koribacter versatilis Ellin345]|uniref:Uncharacterized protein n=1 Tax=Koribacter versatilis (strain Ellin345) TaxID=204669 RepID=Q1IP14_KORVE|nr:hypothetical protein [Candidatus Koribacter versatilis]ABF41386.1 hypothetical protein Acid345_2385 [Candidatus Koribacter versatilis Ellin345]